MFERLTLNNRRITAQFQRLILLSCFALASFVQADDVYVPPALEDWKDWVLAEHPDIQCPINDTRRERMSCIWISRLVVKTHSNQSIEFSIHGTAYADGELTLPHGDALPHTVRLNNRPAEVGSTGRNKRPVLHLPKGAFNISGQLNYERLPRSINIPAATAIVHLELDGIRVERPRIENRKLWLREQSVESARRDALTIDVFRKFIDDIPQRIETRLRLTVAGNNRVISLGNPLPEGFSSVKVTSQLPVQIDADGLYRVQVSRGEHWLDILAIGEGITNEFEMTTGGSNWPTSEIWAIETVAQHRTVDVEGVEAIDPNIVESPFGRVNTYLLRVGEQLRLANEMRGDPNPETPRVYVNRILWLASDGSHMIVNDELSVHSKSELRLNANYELGSVHVDDIPRLITYLDGEQGTQPGVTLHPDPDHAKINALSQLGKQREFSAVGWQTDAERLYARLSLPPGWKLLWTTGIDKVNESWLSSWWNLWDIFLCVLLVVVVYRLAGVVLASLVTVSLLLSYQDFAWTAFGWLILALIGLLLTATKSERFRRYENIVYWMVLLPVALASIYFASVNLRQAVYPQLEPPNAERPHLEREEELADGEVETIIVTGSFLDEYRDSTTIRRSNFDDMPSPSHAEDIRDDGQQKEPRERPALAIQTGPAFPRWEWNRVMFDWSGPVDIDQKFTITLMPPYITRVVFVLIAVLHLLILAYFVALNSKLGEKLPPKLKRFLPLLTASVIATSSQAEIPDQDMLDELANRLTEIPACVPGCSSLERAEIRMTDVDGLTITLTYPTSERVAVPLPEVRPETALDEVRKRNGLQPVLRKNDESRYVVVEPGNSQVSMHLDLRGLNELNVTFPIEPAVTTTDVCCWSLNESVESRRPSIVLKRPRPEAAPDELDESNYQFAHWLVVSRYLNLDFEPRVRTVVRVRNKLDEALSLEIPTLDGETVLSDHVLVSEGRVVVAIEENEREISWDSVLELEDELQLTSAVDTKWVENWYIRGSDFWRFEASGLTKSQSSDGYFVFKPRLGESLSLNLTQPRVQPGASHTVNRVTAHFAHTNRAYWGYLDIDIAASSTAEFQVELPPDAQLHYFSISSEKQPLESGNVLVFPLQIGEHEYMIHWKGDKSLGIGWRTPEVTLSSAANNVNLAVSLPENRWVLLLGGPAMGSAILFWGVLLVTIAVVLALALLPKFPLRKTDALLLAIGATLANIWALLFVGIWAIGIWWRARMQVDQFNHMQFNGIQIALAGVSLLGILALFFTVFAALWLPANMFIVTDHPSTHERILDWQDSGDLQWFSDIGDTVLPTAWVVSLPFWVYQLAMLAWSLWLAFALVRWSKGTFNTLTAPIPWRKKDQKSTQPDETGIAEEGSGTGEAEPAPA